MPTGQLCSQCHELGHNKLSPRCSVNIANKQSGALAAITAARSNNLNLSDSRNTNIYAQQFNPSPANEGEFNSMADTNLLNDSSWHPTTTPRPNSLSRNQSPRSAHSNSAGTSKISVITGAYMQSHGGNISAAVRESKIWVRSQEISKISVSQRQDLRGKISVDQLPVSAPSHTVALP